MESEVNELGRSPPEDFCYFGSFNSFYCYYKCLKFCILYSSRFQGLLLVASLSV